VSAEAAELARPSLDLTLKKSRPSNAGLAPLTCEADWNLDRILKGPVSESCYIERVRMQ